MANVNRVTLICRLTRDVETRAFQSGGKVAKFGAAVNNRKKMPDGSWGDEPVFLDVECFGKTAENAERFLRKGSQVYIEGRLRLDQWEKDGQKRTKLLVVAEQIQFLDPKPGADRGAPSRARPDSDDGYDYAHGHAPAADGDDSIPF